MKKIITALLGLCIFCVTAAQRVKRIEYFIDSDPGTGKGKAISITQADTVLVSTAIQTPVLTAGVHVLYVRSFNDNGWGTTENYSFFVTDTAQSPSIINAEYFFDSDPGTAQATPLNINATDTFRQRLSLPTASLSEGMHTVYIRMQNSLGRWSLTENAVFYVTNFAKAAPKLNGAEYFIDTDPGLGNAKKLPVPGASDTLKGTISIKVPTGLDTAVNHYFCIRFRNMDGTWSLYELDTFRVNASGMFANLELEAVKENKHAKLKWTSRTLTDGIYEVEKSIDGIDFSAIHKLNVQRNITDYLAEDNHLSEGSNYYRIKHTNANGVVAYSSIRQLFVTHSRGNEVRLFPNPAKDMVNISFNGKGSKVIITIFDAGGRNVRMFSMPLSKTIRINISDLAAGHYTVHISDGETISTGKLVKQ